MVDNHSKVEDVHLDNLLNKFDDKYFSGTLSKRTSVSWSEKMTLCTGKTYLNQRNGSRHCLIKLSKPILIQRSYSDVINTLLHEMIHAHLFLKKGKVEGNGHGEDFKNLMKYINGKEGTKIKICHSFRKEVDKFRVNIYKCNGPCRYKKPYYGVIKRAITRPPGPEDHWWKKHEEECGGVFEKVDSNSLTQEPSSKLSSNKLKLLHPEAGKHRKIETSRRLSTKLIEPLNPESRNYKKAEESKFLYAKVIQSQHPDIGNYRKVEGNVDINYSCKIKRINIQKYIKKYFENPHDCQLTSNNNNYRNSPFRRHLLLNVEKYVKRMKDSLKYQ